MSIIYNYAKLTQKQNTTDLPNTHECGGKREREGGRYIYSYNIGVLIA